MKNLISNSCRFFVALVVVAEHYLGWPEEEVGQEQQHKLLYLSNKIKFEVSPQRESESVKTYWLSFFLAPVIDAERYLGWPQEDVGQE